METISDNLSAATTYKSSNALNLVHEWVQLASRLWNEDENTSSPLITKRPTQRLSDSSSYDIPNSIFSPARKITPRRVSLESANSNSNTSCRTPLKDEKKRIQPMSIPLKPPDIQNLQLFPPINSPGGVNDKMTNSTIGNNKGSNNPFTSGFSGSVDHTISDIKVKKLEAKMVKRVEEGSTSINNKMEILTINKVNIEPEKSVRMPRSSELLSEISPEKSKTLDKLAEEYSESLNRNLCRNVLTEISYLFQLLTSNVNNTNTNLLFSTISARVYFVIKVIHHQIPFLIPQLDSQICHLLIENFPHRIPKPLRRSIEKIINTQQERKTKADVLQGLQNPSTSFNCVTFQTDTDGKSNFPNQSDFHAFCKQRDIFYSIKDVWEATRTQNGSTVSSANIVTSSTQRNNSYSSTKPDVASSKIKTLFQLNSSSINMTHLASLFLSQFLLESLENKMTLNSEIMKDENVRQLYESNPSRFQQLQNRFLEPPPTSHSQSYNTAMAFPKFFITLAASPEFNQHLIDATIMEINKIESSLEGGEINELKEILVLMKKSLLLAQMLGYVHFLPYRNEGPNAARYKKVGVSTIEQESSTLKKIELRSYQNPPLDLTAIVLKSYTNKRLVFTLPWVIEFLLQADSVTFYLPNYRSILQLILFIYRHSLMTTNELRCIALANRNFLRFYCGALFSMDMFPYVSLLSQNLQQDFPECYEAIVVITEKRKCDKIKYKMKIAQKSKTDNEEEEDFVLDYLSFIGEISIKSCFLYEMNKIKSVLSLNGNQQGILSETSSSGIVRHIRPVAARANISVTTKNTEIQMALEASFFHGNPPSVKKSVDFIAERIASNFVKTLRNTVYPKERNELLSKGIFGEDAARTCRINILSLFENFSKTKCEEAINIIIGDTISTGALSICHQVTYRKCIEKVVDWVKAHINADMFPIVPKLAVSGEDPPKKLQPKASSFQAMITIHRCLQKIHNELPFDPLVIDRVLDEDLLGETSYVVCVTIDICLAMSAFTPNILTSERLAKFVSFWKKIWKESYKILCPRNLVILSQSKNPTDTWKVICNLVKLMLDENLLNVESLEEQCMTLLRQDWPNDLELHVSKFLRNILSSLGKVCGSEDTEVIDWIAWYCSSAPDDNI